MTKIHWMVQSTNETRDAASTVYAQSFIGLQPAMTSLDVQSETNNHALGGLEHGFREPCYSPSWNFGGS